MTLATVSMVQHMKIIHCASFVSKWVGTAIRSSFLFGSDFPCLPGSQFKSKSTPCWISNQIRSLHTHDHQKGTCTRTWGCVPHALFNVLSSAFGFETYSCVFVVFRTILATVQCGKQAYISGLTRGYPRHYSLQMLRLRVRAPACARIHPKPGNVNWVFSKVQQWQFCESLRYTNWSKSSRF